jgi:hypothetical protein
MPYKVLTKERRLLILSRRTSALQHKDGWDTTYRARERTLPPVEGTKLFVFKELAAALYFRDARHEIWECEAENMEPASFVGIPGLFEWFWQDGRPRRRAPWGTHTADSVTLLRRVA